MIRDDEHIADTRNGLRSNPTATQELCQKVEARAIAEGMSAEGRAEISELGHKCEKLEALLHITENERKAALTRAKPTSGSRKVLSKARYITREDLLGARRARTEGDIIKKKNPEPKAQADPPPALKRRRVNEDVISAHGPEVEAAMRQFEEEEIEYSEEAEMQMPLAPISINLRRSARNSSN